METPLSMRRLTRSQTSASQNTLEVARTKAGKNAGEPRAALHDITNDSPIVGLATDRTPASRAAKSRPRPRRTPGSGEALLRGQVKTLLQRVQEEGGAIAKPPAAVHLPPFRALLAVSRSPAQLLAPTPTNTPQLGSVSGAKDGFLLDAITMPCVLENDETLIPGQGDAVLKQQDEKHEECLPNRMLMFEDSPAKTDFSSLTFQESSSDYLQEKPSPDDDSSSAWSIQVNASSEKGDDDGVEEMEEVYGEEEEVAGQEKEDYFDDLCEGMSRMSVFDGEEGGEKVGLPEFKGKHTRFIYNSDDEMEGEEELVSAAEEHGVLVLKGLPVPEGKHLRFQDDEEGDDN